MPVCSSHCHWNRDIHGSVSVRSIAGQPPARMRMSPRPLAAAGFLLWFALAMLMARPARAQVPVNYINVGHGPIQVAVNPVTDKIYVVDQGPIGVLNTRCEVQDGPGSVTIIDGLTGNTSSITVGYCPGSIAVNPVTNKIYVANDTNSASAQVTVIDGATLATSTVDIGGFPIDIAVNPVTNKIYVACQIDDVVDEIDGATNAVTTINVGTNPADLAVNTHTNKIYVADTGNALSTGELAIIDGATDHVSYVDTEPYPAAVAVNPVTNQIYVPYGGSSISVAAGLEIVDGNTEQYQTAHLKFYQPSAIALNPATGTVYVTDSAGQEVYVVNWPSINATPSVQVLSVPGEAQSLAVDPVANNVYVGLVFAGSASIINGATDQVTNVPLTGAPGAFDPAVAVNPRTGKAYVVAESDHVVAELNATARANVQLPTGNTPSSVAVNSATNRAYLSNFNSSDVTAIDGTTNKTSTIPAGSGPFQVVLNPLTNKIYTSDEFADQVTVLDGNTQATTAVATGVLPQALAIDPTTNTTYVTNGASRTVTAIAGQNNATSTLGPTGANPGSLVADPVTNSIYVLNFGDNTVTVMGAGGGVPATLPTGAGPIAAAVNPVTNKIYVANESGNSVTVIDGATNATTTIDGGDQPTSIAVNAVTNKIYVANAGGNSVSVIDGATNSTITIPVGAPPSFVAVDPAINEIYVASSESTNLTIIDGVTNATSTVAIGNSANWLGVNLAADTIYAAQSGSNTASLTFRQQLHAAIPLKAAINPLPNNVSITPNPTFTFTANSTFTPIATVPNGLYFQVDTIKGEWSAATMTGAGAFQGTVTNKLAPGIHILYAYATDGQDAAQADSPLTSNIQSYTFLISSAGASAVPISTAPGFTLTASTATLSVSPGGSGSDTLTLSPYGGFHQAVSLVCSGLPSGASCRFFPETFTPSGSGPETATLMMMTTAATSRNSMPWPWSGGAATLALSLFFWPKRKRLPQWLCLILLLGVGSMMLGCAAGNSSPYVPPTPAGTRQVTVIARSASGASASATIALNVQ